MCYQSSHLNTHLNMCLNLPELPMITITLFLACACVWCACLCVCACVYACVCRLACGGQSLPSGVFLNCFITYFLRHGLSLNLELSNSGRLPSQQVPGSLLSPFPQHWDYRYMSPFPNFTWVLGDSKSGPHVCTARQFSEWAISPALYSNS